MTKIGPTAGPSVPSSSLLLHAVVSFLVSFNSLRSTPLCDHFIRDFGRSGTSVPIQGLINFSILAKKVSSQFIGIR